MTEFFTGIPQIAYQGAEAASDFAYRVYDKNRIVAGKRMEDHLRLAACFWHGFCWPGVDMFGAGTFDRPWLRGANDSRAASLKRRVAFEFFSKLDVPFYCFHDIDVMAEAHGVAQHRRLFAEAAEDLARLQAETGRRLLWGTANLFSHPRYAAGAATNPDPEVFAFAAVQVRDALEATHNLGGANYVLWGGREGYDTLLNTDIARELDQLGRFLTLVVDHKHRIGFKGTILIEPKPHEPTKHQYDHDVGSVYGFLKRFGLDQEVKLNIEANHATLAGHSFQHEIALANALGMFGSIDANRGDPQNGWDTDQFPNCVPELTLVMLEILRGGGFSSGGFNFDAKLRRQSIDPADLFHGHIGAIDVLARAFLAAVAIREDGALEANRARRYAGWQDGFSHAMSRLDLAGIADLAEQASIDPRPVSGGQERLENLINRFV